MTRGPGLTMCRDTSWVEASATMMHVGVASSVEGVAPVLPSMGESPVHLGQATVASPTPLSF
jgi:3-hydroxyisobutyrate dehydrogenase-like beta-hydroxyacid dehydrogenase